MKRYILALLVLSLPLQPLQAASHRPKALRIAAASLVVAFVMISAADKALGTPYNKKFGHDAVTVVNITSAIGLAAWVTMLGSLASCALPKSLFGYK